MKKLVTIVFAVSLIAGCLLVCVYPKTYHDSPANSGIAVEANDTSDSGIYSDADPAYCLMEFRHALASSDPMVLASFLYYFGELDNLVEVATNDEAVATVDSAAKLFLSDSELREKALARASDLYLTRCIIPNQSMELMDLRSQVPLRSTDFASYEEYKKYMERQGRLYGHTSATELASEPVVPELASVPPAEYWDAFSIQ